MKFQKYKNKKIYFLGIGGISMYALALLMESKVAYVFGYDKVKSETTKVLSDKGIPIYYEPSINNSFGADICVCTAAIGESDEEFQNVLKNNIPIIYRGEFLGEIIDCFDNSIGISGTHGKSTTSGILSEIYLADKEKNPTILLGAILPSIDSAYYLGNAKDLIFEACEYKDSFLSFRPKTSVILNVRLDHTDYFSDLNRIKESFVKYASSSEQVVVNMDSPDALECAQKSGKRVITYSINSDKADCYPSDISIKREKTTFVLNYKEKAIAECEIFIPGEHNFSNALAAATAALACGISTDSVVKGLRNFRGIKRRFEFLGKVNGAHIYDDYAHHPDEVLSTLKAAETLGFKKIVCVFQPHTYTRLSDFFDDFSKIFGERCENDNFECIFLPTYAAREKNTLGYDTEKLSNNVKKSIFINSLDNAAEYIMKNANDNEMYILMGAGDVNHISKKLLFDVEK